MNDTQRNQPIIDPQSVIDQELFNEISEAASRGKLMVAMSGGVDSSSTLALLAQSGFDVVGATLKLKNDPLLPGKEAFDSARKTCELYGVDHHIVDVSSSFEKTVIDTFARDYARGLTPNPCIVCNPLIKFGSLLAAADKIGCTHVITGHYARLIRTPGQPVRLARAAAREKDQSYFLYRVRPDQLARAFFVLGKTNSKDVVRGFAHEAQLVSADTPDSQDVCFLQQEARLSLIERLTPEGLTPGDIVDMQGRVRGKHQGIAHYTVGQRKGIGIADSEPLYVVRLDGKNNRVIVGHKSDLAIHELTVRDVVLHEPIGESGLRAQVQIRYRMQPVSAVITRVPGDETSCTLTLDEPVYGVSPGQSAVWYRDDVVMGGGFIDVH